MGHFFEGGVCGDGYLSANFLTSFATTAKPLPCSPEFAASIATLKASNPSLILK